MPFVTLNDESFSLAYAFPTMNGETMSSPVFLKKVGHFLGTCVYFIKFPMRIHWKCLSHVSKNTFVTEFCVYKIYEGVTNWSRTYHSMSLHGY